MGHLVCHLPAEREPTEEIGREPDTGQGEDSADGPPQDVGRFERGIGLNSSMAGCYHGLGFTHSLNDRPEEAIPLLERCILLSPQDSQMDFRRGHLGQAHFQLGHYQEAMDQVQAALELKEQYGFTYLAAAIQGMAENLDEGRSWLARARTQFPDLSVESLRAFLSPPLYALHLEGIAKLGEGFAPDDVL